MNNQLSITGTITAELFGPDGNLKSRSVTKNIVTNAGRAAIVDGIQAGTITPPDYIAIGTGSTAAAATDTALETEVARAQGTLSQPTAYTDRCVYTFAAGTGTGTITEVGRLNAASTGTLYARGILAESKAKGASDTLQITYDLTFTAS